MSAKKIIAGLGEALSHAQGRPMSRPDALSALRDLLKLFPSDADGRPRFGNQELTPVQRAIVRRAMRAVSVLSEEQEVRT